jgi:replication-associated recombination protein RarA
MKLEMTIDDMVVNKEEALKLRANILKKTHTIIVGTPGIGKTSSVLAIAKESGYEVIEINSSNERTKDKLIIHLRTCQNLHFNKTIYLFDEIDGMDRNGVSTITKILSYSIHPVIFTANDTYKIPKEILDKCDVIKYKTPTLAQSIERVRQIANELHIQPDYSKVTNDIRQSILSAIYKVDAYTAETNKFKMIEDLFCNQIPIDKPNFLDKIWILDNIPNFYSGAKIYEAYQILALSDLYSPKLLKYFSKGYGKVAIPNYFNKNKMKGNK